MAIDRATSPYRFLWTRAQVNFYLWPDFPFKGHLFEHPVGQKRFTAWKCGAQLIQLPETGTRLELQMRKW